MTTPIEIPDVSALQVKAGKMLDAIKGRPRNEAIVYVVEELLNARHDGVMACFNAEQEDFNARIAGLTPPPLAATPSQRLLDRLFGWKKGRR